MTDSIKKPNLTSFGSLHSPSTPPFTLTIDNQELIKSVELFNELEQSVGKWILGTPERFVNINMGYLPEKTYKLLIKNNEGKIIQSSFVSKHGFLFN